MNDASKIVTAALAGAVIGAATALLLSPTSGKELRGKLKDKLSSAKDELDHLVDQGKQMVNNVAGTAKKIKEEELRDLRTH